MILSGLGAVKSKTLKAAGFADITELRFIYEKMGEKQTLPAWLLFQCKTKRKKDILHTSVAIHLDDSIT